MNYDTLTINYLETIKERVRKNVARASSPLATILDGRVVPEAEDLVIGTGRRIDELAVLFLDICGFSTRDSYSEEEQRKILRGLNVFFSEMVRIVEDYGGTVEKNTGDGLMAYFEASNGVSGTQKAVGASLTMFYTNQHVLSEGLFRVGIEPFSFRIGIETGPVTIARLGAKQRFGGIVAIGTTANVACKMLAKASAGEILLGSNAVSTLPVPWQNNCRQYQGDTGWVFRATQNPYPFYYYVERWRDPVLTTLSGILAGQRRFQK